MKEDQVFIKVKRKLTLEEINVLQIQDEALDIIRGSTTTGKSAESITMANGVRKWLNDFKKYCQILSINYMTAE